MPQDIYAVGKKACYSCLQWDGKRSYDQEHGKIKVDLGNQGHCRMIHAEVKGSSRCDNFYAIR